MVGTEHLFEPKEQLDNFAQNQHQSFNDKDPEQAPGSVLEMEEELSQNSNEDLNGCSTEELQKEEIHKMCNNPLEPGCPIQLRQLTEEQILRIPFMGLAIRMMNILSRKEVKLTPKGYIPYRVVDELYDSDSSYVKSDDYIPPAVDSTEEQMILFMVLKDAGLIKTRLGKMSLTIKGKKLLNDYNQLLRNIVLHFFTKYNTGWYDQNGDYEVGNHGRLYSLWLLHRYGAEWRPIEFYTKEYFKAFPELGSADSKIARYYKYRVFYRLLAVLGLCQINVGEQYKGLNWGQEARKTPLLEIMFSFQEPIQIQ